MTAPKNPDRIGAHYRPQVPSRMVGLPAQREARLALIHRLLEDIDVLERSRNRLIFACFALGAALVWTYLPGAWSG